LRAIGIVLGLEVSRHHERYTMLTGQRIEEDARVQERGIRAKISLSVCRNTKYFQRPTSSYLGKNTPSLQGIGHADMT
jgi:hypothetical protein